MTFSASANPILYQGAIPIFVDSETETWNIYPKNIEIAIINRVKNGKKLKAIIAIHLFGMPYKVDEVYAIADRYDIPIIEDSAEALGSSYKGKKCGSFGILSFNGNKIITTSSGGVLITNSEVTKEKAIFYATQSKDRAIHYQQSEIGYNYRMSNICAGIGLGQMKILEENISLRRANHLFYKDIFKEVKNAQLFDNPKDSFFSNYWLNTVLLKTKEKRESLMLAFDEANIESRPLWKPMHLQ